MILPYCCCQIQQHERSRYFVAGPCPPSPSPCPTRSPSPSPSPKCIASGTSSTGWIARDPHIDTYDGLRYGCQACGEFIAVKSPRCPKFEIQVRFYTPTAYRYSIMSDMVIEHEASPKIQISYPRKLSTPHAWYTSRSRRCRVTFFINGVVTVIQPNTNQKLRIDQRPDY